MPKSGKLSASLEDYLEAIYHIVDKKRAAKAKDIADWLKVTSSSVTGALHSLAERGLVNYTPYDIITLTLAGERIALDVIQKHNVLREFFIAVLEVNESEADAAACKMEHSVSPKILERLIQFVKFVKSCPLGGAKWDEGKGFICQYKESDENCPLGKDSKRDTNSPETAEKKP